eukprot:3108222-Amphidinium_carterae.1
MDTWLQAEPAKFPSPSCSDKIGLVMVDSIRHPFQRHAESVKLERAELKGSSCREDFDSCTQQVVDFLKDHNPDGLADVGSDPRGDGFVTRTLPHFLEFIDEDYNA